MNWDAPIDQLLTYGDHKSEVYIIPAEDSISLWPELSSFLFLAPYRHRRFPAKPST